MKEVLENLYVGNDYDCSLVRTKFSIIHACKTCHQRALGYKGSLPQSHPYYLIYCRENNLYLNLVDMDRALLPKYTHPIIKVALDFIRERIETEKILVHCNQGQSRSPSIALVYLAQKGVVSSGSYQEARKDFLKIYPTYMPGIGFRLYLQKYWKEVLEL